MTDPASSSATAETATKTTTTTTTTTPAAASKTSSAIDLLAEVQDTVSRLSAHKGVTAVLILNGAGDILTQSGDATKTGHPKLLTSMLQAATLYAKSVHGSNNDREKETSTNKEEATTDNDVNEEDDLSFVRIRTRRDEILVAPKLGYTLVVFQDPNESTL